MPWPLPTPDEIGDRLASGYEAAFAELAAPELVDARSPHSVLGALARVQSMGEFDLYLHLQRVMQELLPDTALDDLGRHGSVWGVARGGATAALGYVTFTGTNGLVLPAGLQMSAGALTVTTSAGGTIAGGAVTVLASVDQASAGGNFGTGTVLPLVSPLLGLSSQAAVVTAPGFAEGQDQEDIEAWRGRILDRIRAGVPYGEPSAYVAWAKQVAGVALARELPNWVGRGTVGVVVAWGTAATPLVPTAPQLALVQAHLNAVAPVTAEVVAIAVSLLGIGPVIQVRPDTAQVRAAVTAAFQLFMAVEPGIGGVLEISRLSQAISSASGEYAHTLVSPAANIALGPLVLGVASNITWA